MSDMGFRVIDQFGTRDWSCEWVGPSCKECGPTLNGEGWTALVADHAKGFLA